MHRTAQNRRGLVTELVELIGAPSFSPYQSHLHISSVLHERLLLLSGESLGFKERVCLRSGAVALQHDFRAVGSIAEIHRVVHQLGSIPFGAASFVDNKILQDSVRLPVVHRV
jgi:hypothetical protein